MLRLVYAADLRTTIVKEPVGVFGSADYQPGVLYDASTLYRWDLLPETRAVVAAFTVPEFIKKSQGDFDATVQVRNIGTRNIEKVTLQVRNQDGVLAMEREVSCVSTLPSFPLIPGQSINLAVNRIPIPKEWFGGQTLYCGVVAIDGVPLKDIGYIPPTPVKENGDGKATFSDAWGCTGAMDTPVLSMLVEDDPTLDGDSKRSANHSGTVADHHHYASILISNDSLVDAVGYTLEIWKEVEGEDTLVDTLTLATLKEADENNRAVTTYIR